MSAAEKDARCGQCVHRAHDGRTCGDASYFDACGCFIPSGEARAWIDRQGDVWTLESDGLLHTPETRPFPREYVEKKWGPLRVIPAGEVGAA